MEEQENNRTENYKLNQEKYRP